MAFDKVAQSDSFFSFVMKNGHLVTYLNQELNGHRSMSEIEANLSTYKIRKNLRSTSNPSLLNPAEILIIHAMALNEIPTISSILSTNLDLAKIRTAKIYRIGTKSVETKDFALVEAFDSKGRAMGTFVSAKTVSPCK